MGGWKLPSSFFYLLQLREEGAPFSIGGEDRGVEHVWIGEEEVGCCSYVPPLIERSVAIIRLC